MRAAEKFTPAQQINVQVVRQVAGGSVRSHDRRASGWPGGYLQGRILGRDSQWIVVETDYPQRRIRLGDRSGELELLIELLASGRSCEQAVRDLVAHRDGLSCDALWSAVRALCELGLVDPDGLTGQPCEQDEQLTLPLPTPGNDSRSPVPAALRPQTAGPHATRRPLGVRQLSRWFSAIAATAVVAAFLAPSALAASPTDAHAAAKTCAGTHSISANLNTSDYALLRRYVPCVLLDLLHGAPTAISPNWSDLTARVMTKFERDPKREDTSSVIGTTLRQTSRPFLKRILPGKFDGCAKFTIRYGDTVPPPITLADVASSIASILVVIPPGAAWETWGVYVGHRPLFHDGPDHTGYVSIWICTPTC